MYVCLRDGRTPLKFYVEIKVFLRTKERKKKKKTLGEQKLGVFVIAPHVFLWSSLYYYCIISGLLEMLPTRRVTIDRLWKTVAVKVEFIMFGRCLLGSRVFASDLLASQNLPFLPAFV